MDAKGRVLSDKCIKDEVPFEDLPEGWAWARLEGLISLLSGTDLKPSQYNDCHKGIPYLTGASNFSNGTLIENRWTDEATRISYKGELLFTCKGTVGEMAVNSFNEAHIARQIMAIIPLNHKTLPYLKEFLKAMLESIKSSAKGVIPGIERKTLLASLAPIPPLAEQRRIVERVNELMPLVEKYGKLEDAREALDVALPGRLRKSVLQVAVRGELVPQDPADEPASALLERIRGQRRKLVAEKKMKAPKGGESIIFRGSDGRRYEKRVDAKGCESEPVCIEGEIPFEIPEGWEWTRLESLGAIVGGGTPKTGIPELWSDSVSGIPWITPADMSAQSDVMISAGKRFISHAGLEKSSAQLLPTGSVLMSSRAPIGYLGIAANPIATNQGFKSVVLADIALNRWLIGALETLMDSIIKRASGTTFKEISGAEFGKTLIPLPPLEEQERILESCKSISAAITNQ